MSEHKKMWIVETNIGVAFIGRDAPKELKAIKGHFWNFASRSLGYRPIFTKKADALLFARKARRSNTVEKAEIVEIEFYKGELK